MIPFEELAAALERYAAARRGEAVPAHDPPTSQMTAPAYAPMGGDDESTPVGAVPDPLPTADPSNELDMNDVLTDDEAN
jgi:hypothetical protein